MPIIVLSFNVDENFGLRSANIDFNNTDLPNNSKTMRLIAIALLTAISLNKDDLVVQYLLNELDIPRTKD